MIARTNRNLIFSIILVWWMASGLWAADITVTSTANSGAGTLRQAVLDAQDGDRVVFAPALDGQVIYLQSSIAIANKEVTIHGNGQSRTIISGNQQTRVFLIDNQARVSMTDLSIIDGYSPSGAGIMVSDRSRLELKRFRLEGNVGHTSSGGGLATDRFDCAISLLDGLVAHNLASKAGAGAYVANASTVDIRRVTFRDNLTLSAQGVAWGGALELRDCRTMNVSECAFTNNTSLDRASRGGALSLYDPNDLGADLKIEKSTFSGNTTLGQGGAIYQHGTSLTLYEATLTANTGREGGAYAAEGANARLTVKNSILADNHANPTTGDLRTSGSITSEGYNLIGTDPGQHFTQRTTDSEEVDPLLEALTTTELGAYYHPLRAGSPAVDQGEPDNLERDQLGHPVYNNRRDIGAIEQSPPIYFADFDQDGFGDSEVYVYTNRPANYVTNNRDNCPDIANADQRDRDGDGIGDACEDDRTFGEFFLAAQCADLGSKFLTRTNDATGEIYVVYTGGTSLSAPPEDLPDNRVRFRVDNAVAGSYHLFARIRAPNTGSDSYWVRINGGPWIKWWQGLTTTIFAWREVVDSPFNLIAGENTIDFAYREPNAELEKIKLSTNPELPTTGPGGEAYACNPQEAFTNEFTLEAECAAVGSGFVTTSSANASGGAYVVYTGPAFMNAPPDDLATNRVRFSVDNAIEGYYNLYARVRTPDSNSDSFWVRINNGPWLKWFDALQTPTFDWKAVVGNSHLLKAGFNTIDFAYREPNAQFDKLYFAVAGNPPVGMGAEASNSCQ